MQQAAQTPQASPSIEMSLREHLLAVQANSQPNIPQSPHEALRQSHSSGPQDSNIDPAIGGPAYAQMAAPENGGDPQANASNGESRKGRRELATSKRAAQNRAAQRAFRQRKEEYIKQLQVQVKDMEDLAERYKAVQAENYQLRDYIISLQSRLLESQGEYPQPPSNIDLTQHGNAPEEGEQSHTSNNAMSSAAVSQLQQAAAQAAAQSAESSHNGTPREAS